MCFNVVDTRLRCSPTDVAQVQLLSPKEAKPKDATATANRDALENALTNIGGTVGGLCANRGPHKGQLCTVNSNCLFASVCWPSLATAIAAAHGVYCPLGLGAYLFNGKTC